VKDRQSIGVSRVAIKFGRSLETKLPSTCHRVQARSHHVELVRPVKAASRISSLGPSLLDLDLGCSVGVGVGGYVLALDKHPPAVPEDNVEVWFTVPVHQHGGRYLRVGVEMVLEVMLGDTAPHGNSQTGAVGDNPEDLPAREIELDLQPVTALAGREDGIVRSNLCCLKAERWIEPEAGCTTLESDVGQQTIWRKGNDRLESLADTSDPAKQARPVLSFPHMPSINSGSEQVRFLELDGDSHGQRVVSDRIEAYEQSELEVNPDDDRRVDPGDVLSERMVALHPGRLAAVADLNPVLIDRPSLDRGRVASKRIAENSESLIVRALDPQVPRGTIRFADIKEFGARPYNGVLEEGMNIASAGDSIDVCV